MNNNCCPSCGAQNWKYAEAVYQQGITYSDTGKRFQTELSIRASPPIKDDSAYEMIITIILFFVFQFDFPNLTVKGPNTDVRLTQKEADLLRFFCLLLAYF